MYDAFKYFEPMARLVASEGIEVNAAPRAPHELWLARVVRVLRGRRTMPSPGRTPAVSLVRSAVGVPPVHRTQRAA